MKKEKKKGKKKERKKRKWKKPFQTSTHCIPLLKKKVTGMTGAGGAERGPLAPEADTFTTLLSIGRGYGGERIRIESRSINGSFYDVVVHFLHIRIREHTDGIAED